MEGNKMLIFEMGIKTHWNEMRIAIENMGTDFVMVVVNAPDMGTLDVVFDRFQTRCVALEALQGRLNDLAACFPELPAWLISCCQSDRANNRYDVYENDETSADLFVESEFAGYLGKHLFTDYVLLQVDPFLSSEFSDFQRAI